jgi:branched-chain amino acid transport system ATP-binding protein
LETLLECKEVSKYFGDFVALDKVSFSLPEGIIFGIAGPNGAGKTTLFNVITCNPYPPSSGKVIFNGEEIQKLKPYEIVHKGIARTFQIPVRFRGLTFFKSVMVGSVYGNLGNLKQNIFNYSRDKFEKNALEALELVGLVNKKDEFTVHASLYDLKLLMMASAIATKPKLLLLDEPVSGLTDHEIKLMWDLILKIHKELDITIIIIEHILKFLMNVSDEVMILNSGQVICKGKPEEVAKNPEAIKCYLGEEFKEIFKSGMDKV